MKLAARIGLLVAIMFIATACGSSYITAITWGEGDRSTSGGSFGGGDSALVYEDSLIRVDFIPVLNSAVNFRLTNRSGKTLRIIWDEAAFVDIDGSTSRVMHSGVRYIERNSSQPPTVIPSSGHVDELVVPTDHVYYVEGRYGGWRTAPIVPVTADPTIYDGRQISVILPIEVDGERHEYRFNFRLLIRKR